MRGFNRFKTFALLASLTALLLWIGSMMGGQAGFLVALALAATMNIGSYWFSDRIVLRMYGACEVSHADAPGLHALLAQLAARAGIIAPRLYIVPEDAPNAFATGRSPNHAAVAVTQGLLNLLEPRELAAVMAHEVAHIRNRDTLLMTVAATIAGAISMLPFAATHREEGEEGPGPLAALAGIFLAPLAATLLQMALSRSREFVADESAARFTGDPAALANALRKIEGFSREIPMQSGSPATAHLFIQNPFNGGLAALFRTHPPTGERVARLMAIEPRAERFFALSAY